MPISRSCLVLSRFFFIIVFVCMKITQELLEVSLPSLDSAESVETPDMEIPDEPVEGPSLKFRSISVQTCPRTRTVRTQVVPRTREKGKI